MKVFHTIPDLVADAKLELSDIDIVSFDVFDTLFVRRVHEPDFVKTATARFINNLMAKLGIWGNIGYVMKVRNEVENADRQENGKKHPDFEANYDHFMPKALKLIFSEHYSDAIFHEVRDYEMMMESSMLVARADIVEFLDVLKSAGKRLFLISDMYLPAKYITKFVQDKGLKDYFEAIISSADSFKAKASGAGYTLVQNQFSLDKKRWMHIGDNHHSDGRKATEFGLSAYVLEDLKERQRKGLCFRYHHYSRHRLFWRGRYVQQMMLPLEAENNIENPLYSDGFSMFSYMLGYMTLRLKERLVEMNIKKLFFCSREGWMFKECWDRMGPILWPDVYKDVQVEYLYVSRLALTKASRGNLGLNLQDINRVFAPVQNKDFRDIIRVFGLDEQTVAPYLKEYDLELDEVLSPAGRSRESLAKLVRLINDEAFINQIKDDARPSQLALETYLESVGFFDEQQVAVMDIGWIGTIQYYLTEAISHRTDMPVVNGFLMGADRKHEFPTTQKSRYEGLLYDRMRLQHATSNIVAFKDVLEEICRANHPTLLEYSLDEDGKSKLVYRTNEDEVALAEQRQFEYYSPVHKGIFDGVNRFALAMAVADYHSKDVMIWLNIICQSRVAFAKTDEILRLKNTSHQDDFSGNSEPVKISKKMVRGMSTLWDEGTSRLRYRPLLRTQHFLKAMKQLRRI